MGISSSSTTGGRKVLAVASLFLASVVIGFLISQFKLHGQQVAALHNLRVQLQHFEWAVVEKDSSFPTQGGIVVSNPHYSLHVPSSLEKMKLSNFIPNEYEYQSRPVPTFEGAFAISSDLVNILTVPPSSRTVFSDPFDAFLHQVERNLPRAFQQAVNLELSSHAENPIGWAEWLANGPSDASGIFSSRLDMRRRIVRALAAAEILAAWDAGVVRPNFDGNFAYVLLCRNRDPGVRVAAHVYLNHFQDYSYCHANFEGDLASCIDRDLRNVRVITGYEGDSGHLLEIRP